MIFSHNCEFRDCSLLSESLILIFERYFLVSVIIVYWLSSLLVCAVATSPKVSVNAVVFILATDEKPEGDKAQLPGAKLLRFF